MISFRIDIDPRGKGRPRFGNGRTFTDAKTKAYETALAWAARAAMGGRPVLDGPLQVRLTAFMPIPQSWSTGKQQMAIQGALKPTTKPDADNLLKALDAFNGIIWKDDAQIVEATVVKHYGATPGLMVAVCAVGAPV